MTLPSKGSAARLEFNGQTHLTTIMRFAEILAEQASCRAGSSLNMPRSSIPAPGRCTGNKATSPPSGTTLRMTEPSHLDPQFPEK